VSVKMTKQHIFIIENDLQKVIFSLVPSDNRDTRSTCPTSDSKHILDPYLFSDLIKRQLALSNYNEIEIDLFIVFPSPTQ
jgi:hypothetical protein